jgi:hypothetical protein
MALDNYANFQAAIADHLARPDLTNQIIDCITLFEAEASYELFHQRGSEKVTILVPTAPSAITITNAASNGAANLIRLTLTSTTTLATGNEASVINVGGTTEANGSWIITVIDGFNIDLQNSTFVNAYTNSGTLQLPQGTCSLPSDFLGWRRVTWTGSPESDLEYVHPALFEVEFPTFLPVVEISMPRVFTIEGNTLSVMPVDTTPIEFSYFAKTPALSSNLNWLFTNRVDAYWNGVLEQIYAYTKDYDQSGVYQQKKAAVFDEIKKQRFREDGILNIRVSGSSYGATP